MKNLWNRVKICVICFTHRNEVKEGEKQEMAAFFDSRFTKNPAPKKQFDPPSQAPAGKAIETILIMGQKPSAISLKTEIPPCNQSPYRSLPLPAHRPVHEPGWLPHKWIRDLLGRHTHRRRILCRSFHPPSE